MATSIASLAFPLPTSKLKYSPTWLATTEDGFEELPPNHNLLSWKDTAWGYPLWLDHSCSSQSAFAPVPANVSLTLTTTTVVLVLPVISISLPPIRSVLPTQFASESKIAVEAVTFTPVPEVAAGVKVTASSSYL